MNNFILIGFDRSGTSAISRALACHPEMELIFRPFNSGPIRRKMYTILTNDNVDEKDKFFFKQLEQEKLNSDYFVSLWHKKYSTVIDAFEENKVHVIITNINHFSTRWIRQEYPLIEQWAIWRDPYEILNSCIKNDFYGDWYTDAIKELKNSVSDEEELKMLFGDFFVGIEDKSETIRTALLIAIRNFFLFRNIDKAKIIDYEVFKVDPNKALKPVFKHFKLSLEEDFGHVLGIDLNSVPSKDGYKINKRSKMIISESDRIIVDEFFAPLYKVYQ